VSLATLAPLAKFPATFFSLQIGPSANQARTPPTGMALVDLTSEITDFADTAAIMNSLDLIISVDTAVVHLAGALGRPCWILVPLVPDWRWQFDRTDSPWYPGVRLFRQSRGGDWAGVVGRIAGELETLLATKREKELPA
jgi:hypothetical protein